MKTFTIGWLNKCRCGNKSHTVKTARGNESALWDDDAVKCNSCGRGGVIQVCEGQARVLWETNEEMAEGKPMSKLTKEWLQQTIAELEEERDATPGAVNEDADKALAAMKIALASLEAEPVAWRSLYYENHGLLTGSKNVLASWQKQGWECEPLYTTTPAPIVPDDSRNQFEEWMLDAWGRERQEYDFAKGKFLQGENYADSYTRHMWKAWVASRAAMLQGAEPVQSNTLRDGEAEALSEAVAAIYFTDSSDYLSALFSVVKALSPETFTLLLSNDKAAFDATRLPAAPQQEANNG
ncbi:hypothetical protein N8X72_01040 [Enterobacter hormaechei subsp. hoffmannii]|uniref:hypothetical protein n=1 Tax=Enterobacter hormaechei TaxID=158836 RepID=UPI0018EA39DB|nr:hypothetical protein [Enterobacter hormaechei]MBJ6567633.1 hypothetical protein [Enterobacter hormaechei]MCU3020075.1 hypothetical protein [Enterobacter hormaechei subsp. hoffmannii]MCU4004923.1 hypothetical protein [Enterobacter hormaechei subsp. hoffmannii]